MESLYLRLEEEPEKQHLEDEENPGKQAKNKIAVSTRKAMGENYLKKEGNVYNVSSKKQTNKQTRRGQRRPEVTSRRAPGGLETAE